MTQTPLVVIGRPIHQICRRRTQQAVLAVVQCESRESKTKAKLVIIVINLITTLLFDSIAYATTPEEKRKVFNCVFVCLGQSWLDNRTRRCRKEKKRSREKIKENPKTGVCFKKKIREVPHIIIPKQSNAKPKQTNPSGTHRSHSMKKIQKHSLRVRIRSSRDW